MKQIIYFFKRIFTSSLDLVTFNNDIAKEYNLKLGEKITSEYGGTYVYLGNKKFKQKTNFN